MSNNFKKPLVIIAGPTATGKTKYSIELAKKINGEIISADSMQIYKHMDIGTAKPKTDEMDGIKHYLIDELCPNEEYSIVLFQQMAKEYLKQIYDKGKIPILCGGTGFYINSIVYDNDFMDTKKDDAFRESLYVLAKEKGNNHIHNILKEVDLVSAENIHPNNLKRVIRAIEFHKTTGEKISNHNKTEKLKEKKYNTSFIVLNRDRQNIYDRINLRVDKMIEEGLVKEVKWLLDNGYNKELVSMQGLGYKEIVKFIEDEMTLDEAIYLLKRDTRKFAKRQLTWFRNQVDGNWIDIDKVENPVDEIIKLFPSLLN